MATLIRPELSSKNKYWIEKHRYYELKHFCLQYPIWVKRYSELDDLCMTKSIWDRMPSGHNPNDLTAKYAIRKAIYSNRINLIERTSIETDPDLHSYILKGITEGLSYTYLRTKLNIPCSKDTYYDRYRRFFWLLSQSRD